MTGKRKQRNFAAEGVAFLERQRHWSVPFDEAWSNMWDRLFNRSLPPRATPDHQAYVQMCQAALEWARPGIRAAYEHEDCPMVKNYRYLPMFRSSPTRTGTILALDTNGGQYRENGSRRILELASVDD